MTLYNISLFRFWNSHDLNDFKPHRQYLQLEKKILELERNLLIKEAELRPAHSTQWTAKGAGIQASSFCAQESPQACRFKIRRLREGAG